MARIEFDLQGKGREGDLLVVDRGGLPNLRTEAFPSYIQTLPKAPKLKEGQRAILSYEGNQVYWKVREPRGVTGGEATSLSLLSFIPMYILCRWAEKKWFSD